MWVGMKTKPCGTKGGPNCPWVVPFPRRAQPSMAQGAAGRAARVPAYMHLLFLLKNNSFLCKLKETLYNFRVS